MATSRPPAARNRLPLYPQEQTFPYGTSESVSRCLIRRFPGIFGFDPRSQFRGCARKWGRSVAAQAAIENAPPPAHETNSGAPRKIHVAFPDRIESGINDVGIGGTGDGPNGFFRHREPICGAGRQERSVGEDRRGGSVDSLRGLTPIVLSLSATGKSHLGILGLGSRFPVTGGRIG